MAAIDFITAFGQLLHDGSLRDAFAANPGMVAARLNLQDEGRAALLELIPEDLEFQARVLLRKRLDIVRQVIPETCRRLQTSEWPMFYEYSRNNWPGNGDPIGSDAHNFCRHLKRVDPRPVCQAEWNRLEFAFSKRRLAIRRVDCNGAGNKSKASLQFFLRLRRQHWHEFHFYFGLKRSGPD